MTMKWNVSGGALALVTAVSAAIVNSTMASPRAYLAGAATVRATDYSARTRAARNFARPVEDEDIGN